MEFRRGGGGFSNRGRGNLGGNSSGGFGGRSRDSDSIESSERSRINQNVPQNENRTGRGGFGTGRGGTEDYFEKDSFGSRGNMDTNGFGGNSGVSFGRDRSKGFGNGNDSSRKNWREEISSSNDRSHGNRAFANDRNETDREHSSYKDRPPRGESMSIYVPEDKVGKIIGKGGSKIRELQEYSGAKLKTPIC